MHGHMTITTLGGVAGVSYVDENFYVMCSVQQSGVSMVLEILRCV